MVVVVVVGGQPSFFPCLPFTSTLPHTTYSAPGSCCVLYYLHIPCTCMPIFLPFNSYTFLGSFTPPHTYIHFVSSWMHAIACHATVLRFASTITQPCLLFCDFCVIYVLQFYFILLPTATWVLHSFCRFVTWFLFCLLPSHLLPPPCICLVPPLPSLHLPLLDCTPHACSLLPRPTTFSLRSQPLLPHCLPTIFAVPYHALYIPHCSAPQPLFPVLPYILPRSSYTPGSTIWFPGCSRSLGHYHLFPALATFTRTLHTVSQVYTFHPMLTHLITLPLPGFIFITRLILLACGSLIPFHSLPSCSACLYFTCPLYLLGFTLFLHHTHMPRLFPPATHLNTYTPTFSPSLPCNLHVFLLGFCVSLLPSLHAYTTTFHACVLNS